MTDETLFSALNDLQEGLFVLDANRKVLFANQVAKQLFGDSFIGKDFINVIRHPLCVAAIESAITGQHIPKAVISLDYPVKAKFSLGVSRIGKIKNNSKIMVSLKDVSDVFAAEQMRSDFVANVSHELRSPLTSLSGFIETLRGPAKDDATVRERFLQLMESEAGRMTRLIADLLSLSKVEANLRLRPSGQIDVAVVIDRVLNVLAEQIEGEKKSIEVVIDCSDSLVPGSEDELTQVFQNLIENAIKYANPETVIDIQISNCENVAVVLGKTLAVRISDKGAGVEKHHISRLTERFYRVDTHRSRDKGGTGLGLAIVKHIVNRHRGRLQIESEVGVGSTFTVYLPIE